VVFRAYYRGGHRWRGYVGSDVPGVSYGLCRPSKQRHAHYTQARAIDCARRTAEPWRDRPANA
jgi:hypothetical protein